MWSPSGPLLRGVGELHPGRVGALEELALVQELRLRVPAGGAVGGGLELQGLVAGADRREGDVLRRARWRRARRGRRCWCGRSSRARRWPGRRSWCRRSRRRPRRSPPGSVGGTVGVGVGVGVGPLPPGRRAPRRGCPAVTVDLGPVAVRGPGRRRRSSRRSGSASASRPGRSAAAGRRCGAGREACRR